jgi:peptidoglycan/LPS O-acetylase OafA/YrhL
MVASMNEMPNLDLLRSIAVALVVVEHTLLALHIHWIGSWNIAWLGVVGVFMFFVHTSLVLMWSLERKPHFVDFYIRRIFRIYPLAILVLAVTVIFRIPTMHDTDGHTFFAMPPFKLLVRNLLLVQNLFLGQDQRPGLSILGVMWTLPLEVQMYFLLPFLFFFIRQNFVLWPVLLLWLGTTVYDGSTFPPDSNTFMVCVPYFLSGLIAYILFSKLKPRLPAFLMPVTVAVLLCGFMGRPSWRAGWLLTLILGLLLPTFRQIRSKWLIRASHNIAKYSYGIYLVHPFSIVIGVNLMEGYNPAWRVSALLLSLAVIVVPVYHFMERPMIDLGARLAARVEQHYEEVAQVA